MIVNREAHMHLRASAVLTGVMILSTLIVDGQVIFFLDNSTTLE